MRDTLKKVYSCLEPIRIYLLVSLVVIVWVLWALYTVANEFFQSCLLADEFDEFWDAASAAQYNQFFLFEQELFNCATLLLTQKLVDLDVASIVTSNQGPS